MDFKAFKEKYLYGQELESPKTMAKIVCQEMWKQMFGFVVSTIIVVCWYTVTSLMRVHQVICFSSSLLILLVLTIINASRRAKCVYCLAFFRFCSSRSVLLTAMMYLAATVPFNNITKNFDAISESYTCIKDTSKKGAQAYTEQLHVIKDQINNFTAVLTDRIKKIRERYNKLMAAVEKARHVLDRLTIKCSEESSKTYEACLRKLDNAYHRCRRTVWRIFCGAVKFGKKLCKLAKVGKILCKINEKLTAWIKNTVVKKINRVFDDIHDKLFVEVNVTTSTEIKVNKSKTLRGVKADIKQDLDEYLWPVLRFFMSNLPFTASLLSLPWIILRSHNYVARYVSDLSYDNRFLDYELEQIDARRKAKDKTTVLPLETWETDIYIDIMTPRLSRDEVSSLKTALVRVTFIVLAVISLFYIDLGLYSLVSAIRLPMNVGVVSDSRQIIDVQGNGSMKQLLASMENMTNSDHEVVPDLSPCLPTVSEPDYQQYSRIAIWCVTYGLFELVVIVWRRRLFHVVAAAVFPDRQKIRAQWLVLHILAERRLLHHTERLTRLYQPLLFARLRGNIFFLDSILERSLPMRVQCWSCNYTAVNIKNEFRLCLNLGCKGVYCLSCLALLDYECPLCKGQFFFDHI